MSHEITTTDGLVLTRKAAWHGLGTVVEEAPTPTEALQLAGLEWQVEQWRLHAGSGARQIPVLTHYQNVRSDNCHALGIVGAGYKPVQNAELADFVQALGRDSRVQIESAGSIKGGKRVWFLVRGESIWAGDHDEIKPYLLVANGHDGTLSVTCQPTTIRVVCKNTLHASLKEGEDSAMTVRFRHEGAIADKLEEAKRALGLFVEARAVFQKRVEVLQAQDMKRDELQRFWLEVYSKTLGEIPSTPLTEEEHSQVKRAQRVLGQWAVNFDQEQMAHGANRWTALNAATAWFDHQRSVRAPSDSLRRDHRAFNNWWGDTAAAKAKILGMALTR